MMLKVEISAETRDNADEIINALLEENLVTGGQIIESPTRFNWKGSVVDMDYWTITSFTTDENQEAIIKSVESTSIEEVPMIVFLPFTGNAKLESWIKSTVK